MAAVKWRCCNRYLVSIFMH